jgi:hypothetical protein
LALLVVAGLSIAWGGALWNPLVRAGGNFSVVQLAQWAVFILSAGAFWLAANRVDGARWLQQMVWPFLGLGAVYIGLRLASGGAALPAQLFPGARRPACSGCSWWRWRRGRCCFTAGCGGTCGWGWAR